MNTESDLCSILEPFPPSNKCAQIAKEWIDKGLAKCHEIAVLYPSSRNPPAWIGKIHGITFVDTSGRTEEASRVQSREPSAKAAKPRSSFCLHTSSFSQARTFVLGATRASIYWLSFKIISRYPKNPQHHFHTRFAR